MDKILIKLREEKKKEMKAEAEKQGLSMSSFCRNLIFRELNGIKEKEENGKSRRLEIIS